MCAMYVKLLMYICTVTVVSTYDVYDVDITYDCCCCCWCIWCMWRLLMYVYTVVSTYDVYDVDINYEYVSIMMYVMVVDVYVCDVCEGCWCMYIL